MSNQLRNAIEKMKQYYIERLLEAGVYKETDHQLYQLTLGELESLFRNSPPKS